MKPRVPAMPSARGVKFRCGVHNLQQTVKSAAIPQVVAVDLRGKNFSSRGSITETAALSSSGRIDNGASPIRRESTRIKRKPRRPGACATICAPNVPYSKHRDETEAYGKSSITVACCLCNTSPKTAAAIGSEAVH
jgi:hypothetical protein